MNKVDVVSDLGNALHSLFDGKKRLLAADPEFMNYAFDPSETLRRPMLPEDRLSLLIGEARQALLMMGCYLRPGDRVLEVGGGVGIIYAVLRSLGIEVISLEPGSEGFGDRHRAGVRMLELLGIDSSGWLKMVVEDFNSEDNSFDLIFSYFVLEHVGDLEKTFAVMAKILTPEGMMIHRCPNYNIPFEPHYNIPLVPFKPRWTALLLPGLQGKSLWQNLQFTKTSTIRRLCSLHMLKVDFRRGMLVWAFERVLSDPVFAARRKNFVLLAKLLRLTGLLGILRRLPPGMDTPMEFTARKICEP